MKAPLRLLVDALGYGFFIPDTEVAPATTPLGFELVKVDGSTEPLQFSRVRVSPEGPGDPPAELLLIGAHSSALRSEALEALCAKLDRFGGTPCFWTDFEPGFARTGAARGVPREWTAAAVAVVMYSAAWDDSDPLEVDVDGIKFAVSTNHTGGRFAASVTLID